MTVADGVASYPVTRHAVGLSRDADNSAHHPEIRLDPLIGVVCARPPSTCKAINHNTFPAKNHLA